MRVARLFGAIPGAKKSRATMDRSELTRLVRRRLEQDGHLANIRAHLRRRLIHVLRDQQNDGHQKEQKSDKNDKEENVIMSLIMDELISNQMWNSVSVFAAETDDFDIAYCVSKTEDVRVDCEKIIKNLGINNNILMQIKRIREENNGFSLLRCIVKYLQEIDVQEELKEIPEQQESLEELKRQVNQMQALIQSQNEELQLLRATENRSENENHEEESEIKFEDKSSKEEDDKNDGKSENDESSNNVENEEIGNGDYWVNEMRCFLEQTRSRLRDVEILDKSAKSIQFN